MGRKSVLVKTLSVILVLGWAISAHSLVVPVKSSLEMEAMSDVGGETVTDTDGSALFRPTLRSDIAAGKFSERHSQRRFADLIVIGDIHTMDASAPKAEAIAVAGGRLVFVGDARQARALLRPGGRTIELAPGQSVLPGLVDSHVHMLEAGVLQLGCPILRIRRARRSWRMRSRTAPPSRIQRGPGSSAAAGPPYCSTPSSVRARRSSTRSFPTGRR